MIDNTKNSSNQSSGGRRQPKKAKVTTEPYTLQKPVQPSTANLTKVLLKTYFVFNLQWWIFIKLDNWLLISMKTAWWNDKIIKLYGIITRFNFRLHGQFSIRRSLSSRISIYKCLLYVTDVNLIFYKIIRVGLVNTRISLLVVDSTYLIPQKEKAIKEP